MKIINYMYTQIGFSRCDIRDGRILDGMVVPITTNVGSSKPRKRGVLDTAMCDKICQLLATGRWFSPGTSVSSTNKTDRHDIN